MSNNRYISEQIGIYDWTVPRPIGADAEYFPPFDYKVCVACAAGFSYGLDTTSMRTIEESDAGARSLTLGMASMIALPVGLYALPARSVLTGTVLASGFDAAGQLIGGNEYRPGQTVVAGITGGFTYPLAGVGLLGSMALGGAYGGTNTALNNYVYGESLSVRASATVGILASGLGYGANKAVADYLTRVFPSRIGGGAIDPNKPILLQNIGVLNPYQAYMGSGAGQVTESVVPLVLDKQEVKHDY